MTQIHTNYLARKAKNRKKKALRILTFLLLVGACALTATIFYQGLRFVLIILN